MRLLIASAAAAMLAAPAARAADLPVRRPAPAVEALPALEALPPALLRLECSPYTAESITVIYNEPGRAPWSVRPELALVPLGGAKPFKTRAVYPRGY